MPWTGDQLPWNNAITQNQPPRPSGIWEPLNYFKGPPILSLGGSSNHLPPYMYGPPVKLTSTPVMLYGAPSILAGVRIRGNK